MPHASFLNREEFIMFFVYKEIWWHLRTKSDIPRKQQFGGHLRNGKDTLTLINALFFRTTKRQRQANWPENWSALFFDREQYLEKVLRTRIWPCVNMQPLWLHKIRGGHFLPWKKEDTEGDSCPYGDWQWVDFSQFEFAACCIAP